MQGHQSSRLPRRTKARELFSSQEELVKKFGAEQAAVIMRRLNQLAAADNLALMGSLPPARCHELVGNRAGQFAVSLKGPYRLIFEPAVTPVPETRDGGIDRTRVTEIVVIGVIDYHE